MVTTGALANSQLALRSIRYYSTVRGMAAGKTCLPVRYRCMHHRTRTTCGACHGLTWPGPEPADSPGPPTWMIRIACPNVAHLPYKTLSKCTRPTPHMPPFRTNPTAQTPPTMH